MLILILIFQLLAEPCCSFQGGDDAIVPCGTGHVTGTSFGPAMSFPIARSSEHMCAFGSSMSIFLNIPRQDLSFGVSLSFPSESVHRIYRFEPFNFCVAQQVRDQSIVTLPLSETVKSQNAEIAEISEAALFTVMVLILLFGIVFVIYLKHRDPRAYELVKIGNTRKSRRIRIMFDHVKAHQQKVRTVVILLLLHEAQGVVSLENQQSEPNDAASPNDVEPSVPQAQRLPIIHTIIVVIPIMLVLLIGFMVPGSTQMRLPPVYDPSDQHQSFRTWSQDLMLWTISTDLQPHQQAAMIIAQLRGPARELARSITPQELYNGGMFNGIQLDPVSYLLQGLSHRFAPLDDESRLRAAQELLSFSRRPHESIDALITRFELVRSRARQEGGGAQVSTETASLLLLRACNCTSEQFQSLTLPFGYRLPSTDQQFNMLCSHVRRLGHIIERQPLNIASTLRQGQHAQTNHYHADASPNIPDDPNNANLDWNAQAGYQLDWGQEWSFPVMDGASDTDSATSSDSGGHVDTSDLQGMTEHEADMYLFGEYQHAKRRWRRYTGKPVRALRKVLRKKGKGKGKKGRNDSFLNIPQILQESAYYKGKGKGGNTSGKGFGRRYNPKDRNGQVMRCSICGSMNHLRARCNQQGLQGQPQSQSQTGSGNIQPAAARHMFASEEHSLHFATYESSVPSDLGSWSQVPDDAGASTPPASSRPAPAQERATPHFPEVHAMTPDRPSHDVTHPSAAQPTSDADPWVAGPDPWMQWYQNQPSSSQSLPLMPPMPPWLFQDQHAAPPGLHPVSLTSQALLNNSWNIPYLPLTEDSRNDLPRSSSTQLVNDPALEAIRTQQQIAASAGISRQRQEQEESAGSSGANRVPAWLVSAYGNSVNTLAGQGVSNVPSSEPPDEVQVPQLDEPTLPIAEVTNMFASIHATKSRLTGRRSEESRASQELSVSSISAQDRPSSTPFTDRCTICQQLFSQGEELLRITCGHLFHSLCFSELMQHSWDREVVQCPNCRTEAAVTRTWVYAVPPTVSEHPTEPSAGHAGPPAEQAQQSPSPTPASVQSAVETPVPSDGDADDHSEFHSPQASAFPWWPVQQGVEESASYHSKVRTAQGHGLLIDPGSYGNLVGDAWVEDLQSTLLSHDHSVQLINREKPMHVGGVGKGCQTCTQDVVFPLALQRSDGTMNLGDFTAPMVRQSRTPALLGLQSLKKHGTILDLRSNMMHFIPEGTEVEMILPAGTESYALEQAESGHLMLPFTDFAALKKARSERPNAKVMHMFNEHDNVGGQVSVDRHKLQPESGQSQTSTADPKSLPSTVHPPNPKVLPMPKHVAPPPKTFYGAIRPKAKSHTSAYPAVMPRPALGASVCEQVAAD